MRRLFVLVLLVGCAPMALAFGGCGRAASEEDLGTVVYEIPKVPGADVPFPMPELGPDDGTTSTPGAPNLPLPGALR